jgi:hypothetical protein
MTVRAPKVPLPATARLKHTQEVERIPDYLKNVVGQIRDSLKVCKRGVGTSVEGVGLPGRWVVCGQRGHG